MEEERRVYNNAAQDVRDSLRASLQNTGFTSEDISDLADTAGFNTIRRFSTDDHGEVKSREASVEMRASSNLDASDDFVALERSKEVPSSVVMMDDKSERASPREADSSSSGRERVTPTTSRSPAKESGLNSSGKRNRSPAVSRFC